MSEGREGAYIPELRELELPKMDLISLFRQFGPGLILMMTGIGTSHLVTAPTAGGRFQFALLWVVLVSYIFKYYGFQMAFRFTNATGHSIMDAMCTTRGKWAIWYVMIVTLAQQALGQSGRLVAAAAVMYFFCTDYLGWPFDLWHYSLFLGVIGVAILLFGRYEMLESVTKIFVIVLGATAFYVFFYNPPPISSFKHFVIFDVPAGSFMIIAAFLGLLPTGIDVSLQSSEWGKAKKAGLPFIRKTLEDNDLCGKFDPFNPDFDDIKLDINRLDSHTQEYVKRWFKIGNYDFAFGHWFSFIIAAIFLFLAAMWMYPSDVSGRAVMGEIAKIFTVSVGPHMMFLFLLGAFAACFSTAFNYFDGWPRVVGACCRNLFKKTNELSGIDEPSPEARKKWYSEYNIYRITMVYSLVASVAIIAGLPEPVFLVLAASALALIIAPIVFFLNIWFCLKAINKDNKIFYPGKFALNFSWISLAVYVVGTILVFVKDILM
ncbi:MAG: Nramp family divalent metal transporter [Clostridia bacterium]|nr:Nramp family divalent metal transporter [Clostridia bacterium]